jgi:tRNA(Ile)-lysidine synthase
MRMSRGSGLDGLRGMRTMSSRDGLDLARPLLGVPKSRLIATCDAHGWAFVTDPLNADPRFARVRWRQLMPLLAAEGLTAERLAKLGERAGAAQDAIRWEARRWEHPVRKWKDTDPVTYNMARFAPLPTPYVVCFLLDILERHAPDRSIRLDRCESLAARLHDAIREYRWFRANICGLQITHRRDSYLTIEPEPPRRRGPSQD